MGVGRGVIGYKCQEGTLIMSRGLKICQGCTSPLPLISHAYGSHSGVTVIKQCFKRHCYIAANKPCIRFQKVHFFSFFYRSMGGVAADRVLQSFKPTDS